MIELMDQTDTNYLYLSGCRIQQKKSEVRRNNRYVHVVTVGRFSDYHQSLSPAAKATFSIKRDNTRYTGRPGSSGEINFLTCSMKNVTQRSDWSDK